MRIPRPQWLLALTTGSFPFEDPVVVIRVKGRQLLEALQNGVSKYPALDGTASIHAVTLSY